VPAKNSGLAGKETNSTCALNHSKKFIKVPKKEKAREILLYERENSQSIRREDYGTLSSEESSSHTRNDIRIRLQKMRHGREETAHHTVCECPAMKSIRKIERETIPSPYMKRSWRSKSGN